MNRKRNSKRRKKNIRSRSWDSYPMVNAKAAGSDVGPEEHCAAVPEDRYE